MVSGIFWCNWALLFDSHLAPSESMLLAVLGVAPKDRPRHRNRESGDEDQEPDGVRQELLGRVDRDGMAGVKRSSLSATGPRGSHVSPECSTRKGLFEYATARTMIAELWWGNFALMAAKPLCKARAPHCCLTPDLQLEEQTWIIAAYLFGEVDRDEEAAHSVDLDRVHLRAASVGVTASSCSSDGFLW